MSIIKTLQLPDLYMITGKFNSKEEFKEKLKTALNKSQRIVQLRCKNMTDMNEYLEYAKIAKSICDQYDYSVEFIPIGNEDEKLGPPTQMGLFRRDI